MQLLVNETSFAQKNRSYIATSATKHMGGKNKTINPQ